MLLLSKVKYIYFSKSDVSGVREVIDFLFNLPPVDIEKVK